MVTVAIVTPSAEMLDGSTFTLGNALMLAKRLSSSLSWMLRHAAKREGLDISARGFVQASDLAAHPSFTPHTMQLIVLAAELNEQGRFVVSYDEGEEGVPFIAAWSGHTIPGVQGPALLLKAHEVPELLDHGTFARFKNGIEKHGLLAKGRSVHYQDLRLQRGKWRPNLEVRVQVRAREAAFQGYAFWLTGHNVYLSGNLPPRFTQHICL